MLKSEKFEDIHNSTTDTKRMTTVRRLTMKAVTV